MNKLIVISPEKYSRLQQGSQQANNRQNTEGKEVMQQEQQSKSSNIQPSTSQPAPPPGIPRLDTKVTVSDNRGKLDDTQGDVYDEDVDGEGGWNEVWQSI